MFSNYHRRNFTTLPISIQTFTFDYRAGDMPGFVLPHFIDNGVFPTFSLHNHDEPEFIIIREGRLKAAVNDTALDLRAGDLLIMNPYDLHLAKGSVDERLVYTYMIFGFSMIAQVLPCAEELLGQLREGYVRFPMKIAAGELTERLLGIMTELERLRSVQSLSADLESASLVYRFMSILLDEVGVSTERDRLRDRDFVRKTTELIEKNYKSRLSTADAAEALGYNESYFCALFKRSFGVGFISYLNDYRVHRSLTGDSSNLALLARSVGFTDYCHFNRCFKRRMKLSPSEYFRSSRSE